jgi:hypothetical protein
MKPCTKCGQDKPFIEYYKDSKIKNGHYGECKACIKKRSTQWKLNNPEQVRESQLKNLYGITAQEYNTLIEDQSGRCAICSKDFQSSKHTHLDHCHLTGKIRGILCSNCNRGIGLLKDSVQILENAVQYLNQHSTEEQ